MREGGRGQHLHAELLASGHGAVLEGFLVQQRHFHRVADQSDPPGRQVRVRRLHFGRTESYHAHCGAQSAVFGPCSAF
jgi:hypothetical protein